MERLGMGVQRLGFGQIGAAKKPVAQKKMGGFGSVGKPAQDNDDEKYAREKFGTQKGISSDEFFGRNAYDPAATAQAKERLSGKSTLQVCTLRFCSLTILQVSKAQVRSRQTHTLAALKMMLWKKTMATLKVLRKTLSASSV